MHHKLLQAIICPKHSEEILDRSYQNKRLEERLSRKLLLRQLRPWNIALWSKDGDKFAEAFHEAIAGVVHFATNLYSV